VKLRKKFSNNSTIEDIMSDSTAANVFGPMLLGLADEMKIDMNNTHDMMVANIKNSPLRSLINSTQGRITEEMLDELLDKVNGAD